MELWENWSLALQKIVSNTNLQSDHIVSVVSLPHFVLTQTVLMVFCSWQNTSLGTINMPTAWLHKWLGRLEPEDVRGNFGFLQFPVLGHSYPLCAILDIFFFESVGPHFYRMRICEPRKNCGKWRLIRSKSAARGLTGSHRHFLERIRCWRCVQFCQLRTLFLSNRTCCGQAIPYALPSEYNSPRKRKKFRMGHGIWTPTNDCVFWFCFWKSGGAEILPVCFKNVNELTNNKENFQTRQENDQDIEFPNCTEIADIFCSEVSEKAYGSEVNKSITQSWFNSFCAGEVKWTTSLCRELPSWQSHVIALPSRHYSGVFSQKFSLSSRRTGTKIERRHRRHRCCNSFWVFFLAVNKFPTQVFSHDQSPSLIQKTNTGVTT